MHKSGASPDQKKCGHWGKHTWRARSASL